jgi:hypothetical protein
MSAQHEQPSRLPNPLPSEVTTPVTPQLSIALSCAREDLAKAVRDMLNQPLMKQALVVAFPEPIVESMPKPPTTLKLAQSRSPASGIVTRGDEVIIEYSERAASNGSAVGQVQREILKRAIIETALGGLRHFTTNSSLPGSFREELQLFAQGIARTEALTQSEVRAVVSDVIRSEHDRLQRQKEKLFKKLRESSVAANLPVNELEARINTASALTRVIMSISLIVDQPGAKPEKSEFRDKRDVNPRGKVCEDLELAVKELALNPRALWSRAVFDGDFERADAIAKLRETLRDRFKFDGFNAQLPLLLTPESPAAVQANIDRLLRGSRINALGAKTTPGFSPEILTNTALYVSQALAVTRLERDLRAWTTDDPDPGGLLREDLLTISQQVPSGLVELRDKLPSELPSSVQDFLKTLCLLRLHGGIEGAAYFASVACHNTADEARTGSQLRRALMTSVERGDEQSAVTANEKLQTFLSNIPTSHPEDYISLIGFLAGWPLIPTAADREIGLSPIFGRLTALATSVVYTNTKTIEESFLRNMSNPGCFDIAMLEQLGKDVKGLAEAAKVLRNAEVSSYMEPVTESLSNLIEVLQAETLEAREQLKSFGRVKRAFEKQQALLSTPIQPSDSTAALHVTLRSIHDRIQPFYESLSGRLPEYGPELRRELSELDQAGEIAAFTERIAEGVAVVSALGPSEISTEIEKLIDSKVISIVNMINDAWEYDLNRAVLGLNIPTPMRAGSGFIAVSDALSAGTWATTQLDTLREVFSSSAMTNAPVRKNHIDAVKLSRRQQLSSGLLQHPAALKDYASTAKQCIENPAIRNPSMVAAAERLLNLHLDLRHPHYREVRAEYEELRKTVEDLKKGSAT